MQLRRRSSCSWGWAALAGGVCCHWSPGSGRLPPLGTSPTGGGEEGAARHGNRRSVLSLVPGIWEDPLLGTFSLAGGRGGAAHHGPRGPTLYSNPCDRIRGAVIVSGYFLLNWGIVGAEGCGRIPVTFRGPQGLWTGVWSMRPPSASVQ